MHKSIRPVGFCKKEFLKVPQNSQENTCARFSLLFKSQASGLKKNLALVFSCRFFEVFKNAFFYRTPLEASSADIRFHKLVEKFVKLNALQNRWHVIYNKFTNFQMISFFSSVAVPFMFPAVQIVVQTASFYHCF